MYFPSWNFDDSIIIEGTYSTLKVSWVSGGRRRTRSCSGSVDEKVLLGRCFHLKVMLNNYLRGSWKSFGLLNSALSILRKTIDDFYWLPSQLVMQGLFIVLFVFMRSEPP